MRPGRVGPPADDHEDALDRVYNLYLRLCPRDQLSGNFLYPPPGFVNTDPKVGEKLAEYLRKDYPDIPPPGVENKEIIIQYILSIINDVEGANSPEMRPFRHDDPSAPPDEPVTQWNDLKQNVLLTYLTYWHMRKKIQLEPVKIQPMIQGMEKRPGHPGPPADEHEDALNRIYTLYIQICPRDERGYPITHQPGFLWTDEIMGRKLAKYLRQYYHDVPPPGREDKDTIIQYIHSIINDVEGEDSPEHNGPVSGTMWDSIATREAGYNILLTYLTYWHMRKQIKLER